MSLEVKIADSEEEKRMAYRNRYEVFVEDMGIANENDERLLYDEYDSLETTKIYVALNEGRCIASIRTMEPNKEMAEKKGTEFGLPYEEVFDLSQLNGKFSPFAEISRTTNNGENASAIINVLALCFQYLKNKGFVYPLGRIGLDIDDDVDTEIAYQLVKKKGYMYGGIELVPRKPEVREGKIEASFYDKTGLLDDRGNVIIEKLDPKKMELPGSLSFYLRFGIKAIGKPIYHKKFNRYALPVVVPSNEFVEPYKTMFFEKYGKRS